MTDTAVHPPTSAPSSSSSPLEKTPPQSSSGLASSGISLSSFHRTDLGNAKLFAWLFRTKVRYDHRRGNWLLWEKHWFRQDLDGQVQRYAKQIPEWRASVARNIEDAESRELETKFAYR